MVQGGLVSDGTEPSAPNQYHVMGGGATTANGGGSPASHFDSFIENSGWRRDDILIVLTFAEFVLLLYVGVMADG